MTSQFPGGQLRQDAWRDLSPDVFTDALVLFCSLFYLIRVWSSASCHRRGRADLGYVSGSQIRDEMMRADSRSGFPLCRRRPLPDSQSPDARQPSASRRNPLLSNGYRFAKHEGESIFTITKKCLW